MFYWTRNEKDIIYDGRIDAFRIMRPAGSEGPWNDEDISPWGKFVKEML